MSLSVQRSIVESFSFNGKHVRSIYVKDAGQCLVSKEVMRLLDTTKKMESKQYSGLFLRNIRSDLAMLKLIWRVWTSAFNQHGFIDLEWPEIVLDALLEAKGL